MLAHIALACGFADQSHLSRTFKRATGMAPRTWQLARRIRRPQTPPSIPLVMGWVN
ncbi:helix-turn-helix domain-containing protein [Caulobacter sp. BE254]|uniref:helix-turn-helix domain-containing protein n=1 Tax=Caulobacter sp. BE254 TaxID=2817720 RepID=UPI00286AE448|nr:helix-turn-helix domain-containing protein [Caulobacter sp. BE254]